MPSAMLMDWEHDSAHNACTAWLVAWREATGTRPNVDELPAWTFARHLGSEAAQMMHAGVPKLEMARVFSGAGYDQQCVCGSTVDDVVTEYAAAVVEQRRALTLSRKQG